MASSSISKTAFDALIAKRSVLLSGYEPIAHNGSLYSQFLSLIANSGIDGKQQSPLINAGYAVRLSVVTTILLSFLRYNANKPIQIVILGCGLDVLGLWAHSIDPTNITVYELDTPQITKAKRKLLLEHNLVVDLGSIGSSVLSGCIVNQVNKNASLQSSESNYNLFQCDLRDVNSVEPCFLMFDKSKPTIVLSELVLTYLGRNGMNNILSWCAENVCCAPTSCMAAFELLCSGESILQSVLDGYKEKYCQHFVDKLSKGLAKSDPEELFHPLGSNAKSTESIFRTAGFSVCMATQVGNAVMSQKFKTAESFDEHAALALHVRSYVCAVGFNRRAELGFIRSLCPWSQVAMHDFSTTSHRMEGQEYSIRAIQAKDQTMVRNLYSHTYEDLFEEYSPVRKMVQNGLKTDLSFCEDDIAMDHSTIGARFGLLGGVFLVAIDDRNQHLLGCVGLRLSQQRELQQTGSHDRIYEIHKLAVHSHCRGGGVARELLRSLEAFISCESDNVYSCALVATTPAVLIAANNLYVSNSFQLVKKEIIGKMMLNTYKKVITVNR